MTQFTLPFVADEVRYTNGIPAYAFCAQEGLIEQLSQLDLPKATELVEELKLLVDHNSFARVFWTKEFPPHFRQNTIHFDPDIMNKLVELSGRPGRPCAHLGARIRRRIVLATELCGELYDMVAAREGHTETIMSDRHIRRAIDREQVIFMEEQTPGVWKQRRTINLLNFLYPDHMDMELADLFKFLPKQLPEGLALDNRRGREFCDSLPLRKCPNGFSLHPGDFCLGHTRLKMILPERPRMIEQNGELRVFPPITLEVGVPSNVAREALSNITPGANRFWLGMNNRGVLELKNNGPVPINIHPGSICGWIMFQPTGVPGFNGHHRRWAHGQEETVTSGNTTEFRGLEPILPHFRTFTDGK